MSQEVLLLNADGQPISFLPLSSISWQDAIRLAYLDTAEVLHHYDNWEVHSPSVTMQVPSVMILRDQVRNVRQWMARDQSGPQKHLVFLRDMFVCQYCREQFPRRHLTVDHVIPRYHGGRTRWDNVATCCAPCNCKRGHDITIQPVNKPYRPSYSALLKNMRKFPIHVPHECWNWYLGWDTDKVQLVEPRRRHRFNDFDYGLKFNLDGESNGRMIRALA